MCLLLIFYKCSENLRFVALLEQPSPRKEFSKALFKPLPLGVGSGWSHRLVLTPALFWRHWSPISGEYSVSFGALLPKWADSKGQLYSGRAEAWPLSLGRVAVLHSRAVVWAQHHLWWAPNCRTCRKANRDLSKGTASLCLFSWFASKVHDPHPTPHKSNQAQRVQDVLPWRSPERLSSLMASAHCTSASLAPCFSEGLVAPAAHLAVHSGSITASFPSRQPLPACWKCQRGRIGPLAKLSVQVTSLTKAPLRKNPLLIVKWTDSSVQKTHSSPLHYWFSSEKRQANPLMLVASKHGLAVASVWSQRLTLSPSVCLLADVSFTQKAISYKEARKITHQKLNSSS